MEPVLVTLDDSRQILHQADQFPDLPFQLANRSSYRFSLSCCILAVSSTVCVSASWRSVSFSKRSSIVTAQLYMNIVIYIGTRPRSWQDAERGPPARAVNSFRRLLPLDLANEPSSVVGRRMNRQRSPAFTVFAR